MVNVKKKGNAWENRLAQWLTENGVKAFKDSASGGGNREKGDIINDIDMTIESKAAKNIKLMEWWKQVSKSASMQRNRPVLFIHQDGMSTTPPEWLVVMSSEDWIDLVMGENQTENNYVDPKNKWEVKNCIESLKKVLKHYE